VERRVIRKVDVWDERPGTANVELYKRHQLSRPMYPPEYKNFYDLAQNPVPDTTGAGTAHHLLRLRDANALATRAKQHQWKYGDWMIQPDVSSGQWPKSANASKRSTADEEDELPAPVQRRPQSASSIARRVGEADAQVMRRPQSLVVCCRNEQCRSCWYQFSRMRAPRGTY